MEKILIIDNSPIDQRILKDILKDRYETLTAAEGIEGIAKAREFSPVLILLDMFMPNMDSFTVLLKLRTIPETKNIPIIITTSTGSAEIEEKGIMLGAVDYFTKPFNPGIIRARVKTHVELYILRKKIEELALIDDLTCIPNRRSYKERVRFEWAHSMRNRSPLSLIILDVDCFKQYNDHYGHAKGDEVLRLVAMEAEHSLARRTDFISRYGGEEFVVVLPDTSREGGNNVAEKILHAVKRLKIPHVASLTSDIVTVSMGGATFIPDEEGSPDELFNIADKMLYKVKNGGRNSVLWAM